jgi:solute carrier family 25 phosphate transporter 23/24/25/41
VRTRLAAQTASRYYSGIVGTLRRIVADEGVFGLYRGLGATLLQVVPSLALSFATYETARSAAADYEAQRRGERTQPQQRSAVGDSRRASDQGSAGGAGGEWDLAQALSQREGCGGGGGGSICSSSGGSVSSDTMSSSGGGGGGGGGGDAPAAAPVGRHGLARPKPVSGPASLLCGCMSGVVTATATFPLDVVRRRMQVEGQGRAGALPSYGEVIRKILATRGAAGFYTGLVAEYCKVVPGVAIAYGTYEAMKSLTEAD